MVICCKYIICWYVLFWVLVFAIIYKNGVAGLSEYDSLCHGGVGLGWISALYFIVFIILGGMVLVSLLVGVIITSMELLREGEKEEYVLWEDVRAVQKAFDLSNDIIKLSLELFEVVSGCVLQKVHIDNRSVCVLTFMLFYAVCSNRWIRIKIAR